MFELLIAIALFVAYYAAVARWVRPGEAKLGGGWLLGYQLLVELLIPAGIAIALMLSVARDPMAHLPAFERTERLVEAGLPELGAGEMKRRIEAHPGDVRAHRYYLWSHFRTPFVRGKNRIRDDDKLLEHYERWPEEHPDLAPISNLGLGIYWRELKDPARALAALDASPDSAFPGIALERGRSLAVLGRYREAATAFDVAAGREEDRLPALRGLVSALHAELDWSRLRAIFATTPELASGQAWRALQLQDGNFAAYFVSVLVPNIHRIEPQHALLAFLTLIFWFVAIRWWDRFESEPLLTAVVTVLCGALASSVVFAVNDVLSLVTPIALRGVWWKDLTFSVVMIGLVEEATKFLPVILVRRWTRHVNEPTDWAIYGAYSALGFAVWENLAYHASFGSTTVVSRALSSVPLHITLTALVGMIVFEAQRRGRSTPFALFLGLSLAALAHGVYDFFILGPFKILIIGTLFVLMGVFTLFVQGLGRVLALSPFRPYGAPESQSAKTWFFRAFVMLVVVVYVLQAATIGPGVAILPLMFSTLLNGLGVGLLMFLAQLTLPDDAHLPWPGWRLRAKKD